MSVPAVLIRKSTKEIIKHDTYPRPDMLPMEGMDPDYEWLIENIPFAQPDYDPRIYIMVTNKPDLQFLDSFIEHSSYPGLREYRITYTPKKREKAEIIVSIENAEKEANDSVWSESVHKDKMLFMLSSVMKKADGLQLNELEQIQINEMNTIVVKLRKNMDNRLLLIQQINSNEEPNIDSGWEKN